MKAFVTGHRGFLGRHFTTELRSRGWRVTGVDLASGHREAGQDCLDHFRCHTTVYDLVIHCAALAPHRTAIDRQPMHLARNLQLDAAMFGWAARTGQGRVLYLSSSAAYPVWLQVDDGCGLLREEDINLADVKQPDAGYGWCKITGEQLAADARRAGLPVTVVRPFSGYGEDQGVDWPFGAFTARARRREDPFHIWGDGSQVRDWIHVTDLVNAALAVCESETVDPVNLCTGIGTSMAELVGLVCDAANYTPAIELRSDQPAGVSFRVGDPTRMLRHYTPTVSIEDGVERALTCRSPS